MNTRLKFTAILGLISGMIILFGCDKNMPQVFPQTLYVKFVNSAGENLVEKNGIKIDTFKTNHTVSYYFNEKEYFLNLKINGNTFTPDLPLGYSSPGTGLWSRDFVEFGCWENNRNLKNKRNPYTYEFDFVCPKLFGDDQPRKIEVVWGTKKKTSYNRVLEVKFNGKLIPQDERERRVVIVL